MRVITITRTLKRRRQQHTPINGEIEVRDLKPKIDPKGGATDANKDDERSSHRKGEADFMEGLK